MLLQMGGKTIDEIKIGYPYHLHNIIVENFEILEKEEYIFFTDYPEYFPKLSMDFDIPNEVSNSIIDCDLIDLGYLDNIFKQLVELDCEHIQIRVFNKFNLEQLNLLLNLLDEKRIISVELILPFNESIEDNILIQIVKENPRIFYLIFHSAPSSKIVYSSEAQMGHIFFIQEKINSQKKCGIVSSDFFTFNIQSFTEAQTYNSCLNRKISIDRDGEIKNCPSMLKSYGNIKEITLQEVLNDPSFKTYWNINKDKIHVCKDCEFRYICTDCRAYVENPEDIYSKPLKCGYNPYSGEWSEWSTNPLKQKAIKHYGLEELILQDK